MHKSRFLILDPNALVIKQTIIRKPRFNSSDQNIHLCLRSFGLTGYFFFNLGEFDTLKHFVDYFCLVKTDI